MKTIEEDITNLVLRVINSDNELLLDEMTDLINEEITPKIIDKLTSQFIEDIKGMPLDTVYDAEFNPALKEIKKQLYEYQSKLLSKYTKK